MIKHPKKRTGFGDTVFARRNTKIKIGSYIDRKEAVLLNAAKMYAEAYKNGLGRDASWHSGEDRSLRQFRSACLKYFSGEFFNDRKHLLNLVIIP